MEPGEGQKIEFNLLDQSQRGGNLENKHDTSLYFPGNHWLYR